MGNQLALFGGDRVIKEPFRPYRTIGREESEAAQRVLSSGVLSGFVGAVSSAFYGGPEVKRFEYACQEYFQVDHAVTVNSWTSGLIAAVGALDISPGDEIIVSPWTMSATATAIINWNAIPVFADIEEDMFCLDPNSVVENITPYTKAIMSVDIFGQSADISSLIKIADQYDLKIISDSAQAIGARYQGSFAGTLTDIGGYSLNYHKHIHTGEGGIVVTGDATLAERVRLIRNHGESVVENSDVGNLPNMIGYNFRLGEIESAIGYEQLKKLDKLVLDRQRVAKEFCRALRHLDGIDVPVVRTDCTHVYYVFPLIIDVEKLGVSRRRIVEALKAEGLVGIIEGYTNLHLLPMYQSKTAYGRSGGVPWNIGHRDISYRKGICPVAEKLHETTYISLLLCNYMFDERETYLTIDVFKKVWDNLEYLH